MNLEVDPKFVTPYRRSRTKNMAGDDDKPESSMKNQNLQVREKYTTIPLQCPTLTSSNYTIWAVKLKAIFNVHGLWEVIELTV